MLEALYARARKLRKKRTPPSLPPQVSLHIAEASFTILVVTTGGLDWRTSSQGFRRRFVIQKVSSGKVLPL